MKPCQHTVELYDLLNQPGAENMVTYRDPGFTEWRDGIVERFRFLVDIYPEEEFWELHHGTIEETLEEMSDARDIEDVNCVLQALYDWGDVDKRCWINAAFPPVKETT